MLILLHILIALSSLIFSGYVFFSPSKRKLNVSYGLVALTLASGTYLVIATNSAILAACTSGLLYLSCVLTATVAAHRKLLSTRD
jgi:hypothetical protein